MSALLFPIFAAAAAALAPVEAVARAGQGLFAQIEDEDHADTMLKAIRTEGCTVTLEGEERSIVLNLRDVAGIGLAEPSFIAIARPGGITALVTDGERADQLARLSALNEALGQLYRKCRK